MSKPGYSQARHNAVDKVLANDDRGLDESLASRDVIDIAFMIEAWGMQAFIEGAHRASDAYGKGAEASLRASARAERRWVLAWPWLKAPR